VEKRFLRSNEGSSRPDRLVFVDCETRPDPERSTPRREVHRLWFGWAEFAQRSPEGRWKRETFRFDGAEEFWEWIHAKQTRDNVLWVFAHNLAFDASVLRLWERIKAGEWEIGIRGEPTGTTKAGSPRKRPYGFLVLGDPPTIFKMRRGGRHPAVLVDSRNYFPGSLRDLGASIGVEKLDPPAPTGMADEWDRYCLRDVEIVSRAVRLLVDWHQSEDLGRWKYTAAGISYAAFRHSHLKQPVLLHDSAEIKQLERDAYYGGRLELFRHGVIPGLTYKLDVNSLYPAIMADALVPVDLAESGHESWDGPPDRIRHPETTIADVLIHSDSERFPVRDKRGLIFPVGRYWTTLAGPELDRACRTGSVAKVGRWCRFRLRRMFGEFVERFYTDRIAARKDGVRWREAFCKMLLNSLYGKFGQLTGEWVTDRKEGGFRDGEEWLVWSDSEQRTVRFRSVLGYVFRNEDRKPAPGTFPATSAWITALAREKMRELMETAGPETVVYLVTDALFVSQVGFDRLLRAGKIDPDRLGALKVEAVGLDADFKGVHWYRVGAAEKRGNVRPNAKPVSTSRWEDDQFERLSSLLARQPDGTVRVSRRTAGYCRKYKRGMLMADGSVEPLRLDRPEPPESMVQGLDIISAWS